MSRLIVLMGLLLLRASGKLREWALLILDRQITSRTRTRTASTRKRVTLRKVRK